MIRRLFPHPYLSAMLVIVWMLLVNRFAWGSLVFAVILSIAIPALTEPYWPARARLRHPGKILVYVTIVVHDIIRANIDVALIVLFKPNRNLQPAWITIPRFSEYSWATSRCREKFPGKGTFTRMSWSKSVPS